VREPHLDLLALPPRLLKALGASERAGNIPGVLMDIARDLACRFLWTELRFEWAYIAVELACAIQKRLALVHCAARPKPLSARAVVDVVGPVISKVATRAGVSCRLDTFQKSLTLPSHLWRASKSVRVADYVFAIFVLIMMLSLFSRMNVLAFIFFSFTFYVLGELLSYRIRLLPSFLVSLVFAVLVAVLVGTMCRDAHGRSRLAPSVEASVGTRDRSGN
jgi:hypothetical protein